LEQPGPPRPGGLPRAGTGRPVIRGADDLSLAELNARARELAEKARAGKLAPDEMSGSTFTISNMGMLDVENFTAIINTGEAAILAVSSTIRKPLSGTRRSSFAPSSS